MEGIGVLVWCEQNILVLTTSKKSATEQWDTCKRFGRCQDAIGLHAKHVVSNIFVYGHPQT